MDSEKEKKNELRDCEISIVSFGKWDFSPAKKARLKPHFRVISRSPRETILALKRVREC